MASQQYVCKPLPRIADFLLPFLGLLSLIFVSIIEESSRLMVDIVLGHMYTSLTSPSKCSHIYTEEY